MGGKPSRMKNFAEMMYKALGAPENCEFETNKKPGGKLGKIQ